MTYQSRQRSRQRLAPSLVPSASRTDHGDGRSQHIRPCAYPLSIIGNPPTACDNEVLNLPGLRSRSSPFCNLCASYVPELWSYAMKLTNDGLRRRDRPALEYSGDCYRRLGRCSWL